MKSKILLIGLMTLALICCGCVEDGTSDVIDEYNKHAGTMDDDLTRLDSIVEKRITAYEMAASDNDLTTEEVNRLTDISNEYINEIEFVESHLTSFKEFVVANEQELKDAGADTYQVKKKIDDTKRELYQAKKEAGDIDTMMRQDKEMIDEFTKHADTMMDDATKLDAVSEKWNTAYETAVADGYFTAEEVNQLIGIANEYSDEYDFVKLHLTSFKEFIVANEQELKDAGVDTYQAKKGIDDVNSIAVQNIEGAMIPTLESAIEYVETSEQEEDIEGTIEDLLKIVSIFI